MTDTAAPGTIVTGPVPGSAQDLPVSNQDPAAVATTKADPTNGITQDPGVPVGIKIDESSLETLAQKLASAVQSPEGQEAETAVLGGLPAKVRGTIYSVGGGLAATGSAIVTWDSANPGVLPSWLTAVAGIAAPILAALTGGVAWANLSKK